MVGSNEFGSDDLRILPHSTKLPSHNYKAAFKDLELYSMAGQSISMNTWSSLNGRLNEAHALLIVRGRVSGQPTVPEAWFDQALEDHKMADN